MVFYCKCFTYYGSLAPQSKIPLRLASQESLDPAWQALRNFSISSLNNVTEVGMLIQDPHHQLASLAGLQSTKREN